MLPPHAGIDQHRRRAAAEQGKHQLHKLHPRLHQQDNPHAGLNAKINQPASQRRRILVKLAKRAGCVTAASSARNRHRFRHLPSDRCKPIGNIHVRNVH
jgi:hypothetical protein